jgi:hypothetical protein
MYSFYYFLFFKINIFILTNLYLNKICITDLITKTVKKTHYLN